MFYIDDGFLSDVGLGDLPADLTERYRDAIHDRVLGAAIRRMIGQLPEGLLRELEEWMEGLERETVEAHVVATWLQIRCPEFRLLLSEERSLARMELATSAPELLALEELTASETGSRPAPARRARNQEGQGQDGS